MYLRICAAILLGLAASGWAAEARIVKVLPQLLDLKGRNAVNPSLFDRDAYQVYLREHPEEVSALRFEVQYKGGRGSGPLRLRIEVRGSKSGLGQHHIFETEAGTRGRFSKWARLELDRAASEAIGTLVAWRASLVQEGVVIAEQKSFLW